MPYLRVKNELPLIPGYIDNVAEAVFSDGAVAPLNKLILTIISTQSGSGDPSPDNIRPITGYTGTTIQVSDESGVQDSVSISFGDTVYDGFLVVKTGVLTLTHKLITLAENAGWLLAGNGSFYVIRQSVAPDALFPVNSFPADDDRLPKSNQYKYSRSGTLENNYFRLSDAFYFMNTSITTIEDWLDYVEATPITVRYALATYATLQLTPTEVNQLLGYNKILHSAGNIQSLIYIRRLDS